LAISLIFSGLIGAEELPTLGLIGGSVEKVSINLGLWNFRVIHDVGSGVRAVFERGYGGIVYVERGNWTG
jgi:hypothetical protein